MARGLYGKYRAIRGGRTDREPANLWEKYMTAKRHRPIMLGVSDATRKREVQQEIEYFLKALNSYPDRFAREPYLSFEQHLFSIIMGQATAQT